MSKNFVDNANATALMEAVEESIANTRIFPGTLDEWDALTPEEKAKYAFIATPGEEVIMVKEAEAEISDIVNVYGAKNLIPFPYYRKSGYSTNGLVGTYTDDGVITINKEAGSNIAYFALSNITADYFLEPETEYILSVEAENLNNASIFLSVDGTDITAIRAFSSDYQEVKFTTPASISGAVVLGFYWPNTAVETNAILKPMIRLASIKDKTYAPYAKTNKKLTDQLKIKTIELTNQTTSNDGRLILNGQGHKMAIVSARLLNDNNNHLIVPFGFCYSTNGDALFMLADNSDNTIISSAITISGTIAYLDLS